MSLEKISDGSLVLPPYVDADGVQYPASIDEHFTDAELAARGWRRLAPGAPAKALLRHYAAQRRAEVAGAGIQVNIAEKGATPLTVWVATDQAGMLSLTTAVQLAQAAPKRIFQWASGAGVVDLTAAQIRAIGVAAGEHQQATYASLAEICAGIEAGAITSYDDICNWKW